jgi:hypothetical protein
MRDIELKELHLADGKSKFSYAETILQALKNPRDPRSGMRGEEVLTVGPIFKKTQAAIDSGADVLRLEEAEYKEVAERCKLLPFIGYSEQVEQFLNDIASVKSYDPNDITENDRG